MKKKLSNRRGMPKKAYKKDKKMRITKNREYAIFAVKKTIIYKLYLKTFHFPLADDSEEVSIRPLENDRNFSQIQLFV